ncbi:MAG: GNAT family N-acetyltransferase [Flavobacteriaceae bacterium]|nr:GNAT family N-acetyltransferase [Flavobacteriaceae bacterium]
MITIQEISSKKEIKEFVKLPFKLYKNSKTWVPPIIKEEVKIFDKNINPVFDNAEARLFLAKKNGEIVGRIAAIINWIETKQQNIKKMRFGWFDFIDDFEVSKALLDQVESIGKENNLEFIEGPVGFSNLDKVGLVTSGFDHIANMITWHNHEYYLNHYKKYGLTKEKGYSESKFYYDDINPEDFRRIKNLVLKRYQLKALDFTSSKEILPYTDAMFDVFSASHSVLSSFVEINKKQRDYFKKKFIPFLNPEYVKFVVDKDDKLVAFAIVTPFYGKALQKMNGKLWPFGIFHLLKAKRHSKTATFYLIGVLPEYQKKGVTSIIFDQYYNEFTKNGVIEYFRGPELDDNLAIHQIWKHFNSKVFKTRSTFRKTI